MILAALFHDIGHLLAFDGTTKVETMGSYGVQNHGSLGRAFLESCGVPEPIPALVQSHVDAKRYLVSKYPDYYEKLSPASKETLKHQGGPMTEDERCEFEKGSILENALVLRTYDDQAKIPGLELTSLENYKKLLTDYYSENRQN